MLFQPFALGIVNDLFDEDLDPDLFRDATDEVRTDLAAELDGLLDGGRRAAAATPLPGRDAARPRRLS